MDEFTQMLKLPDGRMLAYAQFGDPSGKPLFLFHGWPSSRLAGKKYDPIAKNLHIRIIAPDRPGMGLSDYKKHRTLLEWPRDVLAIADHLNIPSFAVMGVSGGGPYAAACGYAIPGRIIRLGIVAGLAPVYILQTNDGMPWASMFIWKHYGNPFVRAGGALFHMIVAKYLRPLGLYRMAFGAQSDRILYKDKSMLELYMESAAEAFRRGYRGPRHDLKIYADDWGFNPGDIHIQTYLWYGDKDQNVPIPMARYYASSIKGSILTVYPGEGHLVSISHAQEILGVLAS